MSYELELISLRCNDAQERTDEPYLLINGHVEWGPADMRTDSTQSIGRRVTFNHDVVVELRESDRHSVPHRKDDKIGTMRFAESEVQKLVRGDRSELAHTFTRKQGIFGDARYTLTYDIRERNDQAGVPISSNIPFVFNVRERGALGIDPAIDTSVIEEAIRACKQAGGGIILYPTGTYLINKTITCSSAVPIFHLGQGESTIIKATPPRNASDKPPAFTMFNVGHGTGPRVFANMVIDGNKVAGVGIHFQSGGISIRGNRVRNVRFKNHRSIGVQSTGQLTGDSPDPSRYPIDLFQKEAHEIVIDSCSFASIGERAVYFYYLTSGGVWDCEFDNKYQELGDETSAITFVGCTNFTIARNRVTNWTFGINVGASANYSIIDNHVRNTKLHGIVASGGFGLKPPGYHMSRRFVCAGNQVYNAGGHGITVDPQWYVLDENNNKIFNDTPVKQWGVLTHNLVHRTGAELPDKSHGIFVNWSKHMLIHDNEVIESSLNGISLNESSHCTVVGNKISGWGSYGIGIHKDTSILGFGCHYLGDDNVLSDEPKPQTNVCADEDIRCPGEATGEPCAKVYQIMGGFYVVEDETEERVRVYVCQKLTEDSYDWVQIV